MTTAETRGAYEKLYREGMGALEVITLADAERAADTKRIAELEKVLRGYERWEADMIEDSRCWDRRLPMMTQAIYDRFIELQDERNAALKAGRHRAALKSGETER